MKWGLAKTDGLGVESFFEAIDPGMGLYTRCGYRSVQKVNVNLDRADATAEWQGLSTQLMDVGYTAMWRRILWGEKSQSTRDELLMSTTSRIETYSNYVIRMSRVSIKE